MDDHKEDNIETKAEEGQPEFEQEEEDVPSFSFRTRNTEYNDPLVEDYEIQRDNLIGSHEKRENAFWGFDIHPLL